MAIGPVDYSSLQSQLNLSPLAQGFQLRQQRKQFEREIQQREISIQLSQAKFQQEQLENEEYKAALRDLSDPATGGPTSDKFLALMTRFPEHANALGEGFKTYNAKQQQDVIGSAVSVLAGLTNGNTDAALRVLDSRSESLRRGGVNTDQTDAVRDAIKAGNIDQARALMGLVLTGALGADAGKVMESLGMGPKAERDAEKLELDRRRVEALENRTDAAIARGLEASGRADAASARAERKAKSGGSGGGRKGRFSDAQLDALIQ